MRIVDRGNLQLWEVETLTQHVHTYYDACIPAAEAG